MPNETAKPAAVAADPRDVKIGDLEMRVATLSKDLQKAEAQNDALTAVLDQAERKLRAKAAETTGDYCVLRGKTYQVAGTVQTRFASEEGRKNNTEDEELVILKR